MNTAEFVACVNAAAERIRTTAEQLNSAVAKLRMRDALDSEASLLRRWPKRAHNVRAHRTMYLRSNYTIHDVSYLERLLAAPDPMTALAKYQDSHQRALKGKRRPIEADPDPHCPEWRERPARYLTAEQMACEQFSGRALQRELRRIRRVK